MVKANQPPRAKRIFGLDYREAWKLQNGGCAISPDFSGAVPAAGFLFPVTSRRC